MEETETIQIRSQFDGHVIFEHTRANNTAAHTVSQAVEQNISLRNADLYNANLCDANLRNADLRNADLRCANLRNANLCDANLRNADLRNADLRNADLRNADLRCANLRNANLCDANLYNANLRCANLRNANLCDANLRNADLRKADLRGCVIGYSDANEGYGCADNLIQKYSDQYNIEITKYYENHDAFSCACGAFWRNLIIIREWKIAEEKKTFSLMEDEKNAIRAFAKLHGVTEVWHSATCSKSYFSVMSDSFSCGLDMNRVIENLDLGKLYKVNELVGDN